jgi:RNA polymerase sigma-70 factor (ECF subfamily)
MVSHAHLKTDDRSDEKLIAEIVTARSQDAFAELLRRYERGAYGLALRITSHRQAAEETVQEAMLRIWISASSYRGEGSVKGWILSVVARESIRTIKATKRKSNQMEADFNREQHEADPSPLEDVESAELAEALRREVDGLPALDRQLVALHFGGGISQLEISQALSIPQQTISYRISTTLKTLKSRLSAAGHAAAIPLLSAKGFIEIFCDGVNAPSGLREKVLSNLGGRKSFRSNGSVRKTALQARTGGVAIAVGLTMLAAAVAGVLWAMFSKAAPGPATPSKPAETQMGAAPAEPGLHEPLQTPVDLRHRWTFENGPPHDLSVIAGTWAWNKDAKTMDIPDSIMLRPAYSLPAGPLLFTARGRSMKMKMGAYGFVIQRNGKSLTPTGMWLKPHNNLQSQDVILNYYIYQQRAVLLMSDDPGVVIEFAESHEDGAAVFQFDNFSIQELLVTPLKEDEVPNFVKHPEQITKDMTKK